MGIISYIKSEVKTIRERDPAMKSDLEVFLYPGFKAVIDHGNGGIGETAELGYIHKEKLKRAMQTFGIL